MYYPETTSTGYFLTKIAEGLAQYYPVGVLTGPATSAFEAVNSPFRETVNAVKIFRGPATAFNKDRLLGRVINVLTRSMVLFFMALVCCRREDSILVVTNPPLFPFIALAIKYIKGVQIILLVHDVYPEVLVAAQLSNASSPIIRIIDKLTTFLYIRVNQIVTIGRDMSQLLKKKIPAEHHQKIECIYNWADLQTVFPTNKSENSLVKELNLNDHFIVLHAGNMGRTHDLEILAKAAVELEKGALKIHFLFIGFGAKGQWLKDFVDSHSLTNLTILDYLPVSEKNTSLNACDVGIISFVDGMKGISVPSRMYNQLAAGKPIIAVSEKDSELSQVLLEEEVGWVIEPGNTEHLIQLISSLAQKPETYLGMGARAASVAKAKYGYKQAITSYVNLFQ